ncbi:TonB-dependent receptor [Flavobacterium sp. CS20]|uniref:TonB-dependent receptor n=1 Tax=Flavobacterium sp. CS20 TaxID=2775246 RepID=UPI001B39D4FB|nr:TonB-dependent receptor [Flavobacterium sp. CS20]QTY27927.1 TonB-dependent receptor [Flavobacterium sp. CS20]
MKISYKTILFFSWNKNISFSKKFIKTSLIFMLLLSLYNIGIVKAQNISEIKVSVELNNAPLIDGFRQVEAQSNLKFVFNQEQVNNYQNLSLKFENQSIEQVLKRLLEKTFLTYEVNGNNIIIIQKDEPGKVTGVVTDKTSGEPIPGVNIKVKGINTGAITDLDGRYIVDVPNLDVELEYSYLGYIPQTISVNERRVINIQLESDVTSLNEVVLIGYGKQKKRDVTGSVESVNSEDFKNIPVANPLQLLKGQVSGVDVFNGGHEPGSPTNIRIRGARSIGADNEPLIVLDGIPISGGLNDINPNDIASFEILKDASATAIYGSRASNGVILITTKRGEIGETRITYDGYYGITSVIHKIDLMNGEEFAQLRREANRTIRPDGSYPDDEEIFDNIALESLANGNFTDWQDFTYDPGYKQNHQISIRGGNQKTQFATSINFFDEKGIVESSTYNRASLRINLDHKVNERFKFGVSSFGSYSKQDFTQNDLYDNVLRLSPLGVPYDEEGNIRFRPTNDESQRVNPLSDIQNSVDERFKTRIFSSIYGEYKITDDLTYQLKVDPDLQFGKQGYFYGSETTNSQGGASLAGKNNFDIISITVENILSYDHEFNESHSLSTTLVQSYQNQVTRSSFINVRDLPYDSQSYNNLGSATEITGVGSNYQKWRLLSYTGRLNYQFKKRYLLTVTARTDGSSRFAEGNKWGFFPSATLAWRISDEPFFKLPTFSDLKLRVSYGETGNTGIQPYQTFSFLNSSSYAFGDNGVLGFVPGSLSNPDLRWETTKQFNLGLDFEFWNQHIGGSINYYVADTEDLLLPRSIPTSTGFESVLENIGSTRNKGLEINLSFKNILNSSDFNWRADLSFATNKNKITELFGNGQDDVGNNWFIGQPINVFYDYKKIGIWQTNEAEVAEATGFAPGDIKIEDINNDGLYNADDRTIIGSANPEWIGGLTNSFTYKNLALSFVLYTRQNYKTFSQFYVNNNRLAGRYNNLDVDYWTPENPTNANPRPNVSQESVFLGSTLAYKDVSFVRIRNIALSYSLPKKLTKNLNIQDLTLTLIGENPFTFTSYEGFDPEFESNGERALYPSTKMYSLNLNVTF